MMPHLGYSEAPGVPFGILGTQRRIKTAADALAELTRDELVLALSSIAARKGRAWVSCVLRDATEAVERGA